MSSSPTLYKDEGQNSERRSGPRNPLKWVVLAYFGQDNWGKLVDLSESGMCFEFAQPPSDRERINFMFEAMGCLPDSFGGEIISDSFRASGDVRWTRDFERTAGVQFVSLPEESREQIRKWLSLEASAATGSANTETEQRAPVPPPEPCEPDLAPLETSPAKYGHEYELPLEAKSVESGWEQLEDPSAALTETFPETPAFDVDASGELIAEEGSEQAKTSGATPWLSRTQSIGLTVGLATAVVIGGVRMIQPRLAHGVPAVERLPNPAVRPGESVSAEFGSAAGTQRPFLVEVLDASNRRWLLWFDDSNSRNAPTQAAYKSSPPFSAPSPRSASRPKQPAASPKPAAPHKFTLIAPRAIRPQANHSAANLPSPVAPLVRDELQRRLAAPIVDTLSSPAIPSPGSTPVGGQVQVARLLKSVPPVYPPMARTNHVSGDVILDALIDANGNVTELKVVSGPPILRQAAADAVWHWKYDPARLNGRPVPIHLDVTVKFRFE